MFFAKRNIKYTVLNCLTVNVISTAIDVIRYFIHLLRVFTSMDTVRRNVFLQFHFLEVYLLFVVDMIGRGNVLFNKSVSDFNVIYTFASEFLPSGRNFFKVLIWFCKHKCEMDYLSICQSQSTQPITTKPTNNANQVFLQFNVNRSLSS